MGARLSRTPAILALAIIIGFAVIQVSLLASIMNALRSNADRVAAADGIRLAVAESRTWTTRIAAGGSQAAAARRSLRAVVPRLRPRSSALDDEGALVRALNAYADAARRIAGAPPSHAEIRAFAAGRAPLRARLDRIVTASALEGRRQSGRVMPTVIVTLVGLITAGLGAYLLVVLPLRRSRSRTGQRLSSLFEQHPDAIFECDERGTILRFNPAAAGMFLFHADELVGRTFGSRTASSDRTLVPNRLAATLAGEAQHFYAPWRRGDDTIIDVVCSLVPSVADGRVIGCYAILKDLSDIRQAERALDESRQRLQSLFEEHLDAAAAVDLDGTYVMVNRELERLSGYTASELIGTPIRTLVAPECLDFVRSKQRDAIEGRPSEYDAVLVQKDGTRVDVVAKAFPMIAGGAAVGVYVMLRDMTAQRKIERRMHQQHEQFRSLFEHHSDAVVALDLAGRFTRVNVATEMLTGFVDVDLLGRPFDTLILSDELPQAAELYSRVLSGEAASFESVLFRKDGLRIVVHGKMIPIFVNSHVIGTYAIFRDITEQREMERREREVAERAVEASRLKSQFVATMSHEIRTPLNGIIGMSELLSAGELSEVARERAETIRESADSLLAIVNDILDFSKLEAGKMELERAAFSPRDLIARSIEPFAPGAAERSIAIETAFDSDVPEVVMGDGGKVRQILTNLIGNAMKFTEHGTVSIALAVESLESSRAILRFSVRDTGLGIAPDVRRRLFAPFVQADGSTSRRFGGTGLGLSICKALVELMAGTIGAESSPGNGSTFWFTAGFDRIRPRSFAATPGGAEHAIAAASGAAAPQLRILLVEDHPVNQKIALQQLRHLGFDAAIANNGREAIDAVERERYDVILMDCQMPEVDGYEATRTIRSREAATAGHVRIVAMTANAFEGEREACLRAGMDDYLAKPVRLAELRRALERSLPAAEAR